MPQVDIPLTYSQLMAIAGYYNIQLDPSVKYTKWELILLLRDYIKTKLSESETYQYLKEALLPYYDIFNCISIPQLSYRYELLHEIEQREVMHSSDWVFEEKLDGYRSLFTWFQNKHSFWLRALDPVSFLPARFRHVSVQIPDSLPPLILDGEIIPDSHHPYRTNAEFLFEWNKNKSELYKKYSVSYYAFDILYYDGEWLLDRPYHERMNLLQEVLKHIPSFYQPRRAYRDKVKFLNKILREGKEGVIAKNIFSTYDPYGKRSKSIWVKVKRNSLFDKTFFSDTFDGWVSGVIKNSGGMVRGLEISSYVSINGNKVKKKIAEVPLTLEQSLPFLNGQYLGLVVEVDGEGFNEKGELINPVLISWRFDKTPDTCYIEL